MVVRPPATLLPPLLLLLLLALAAAAQALTVWPKPQSQINSGQLLGLDRASFDFRTTGQDSDILRDALRRYVGLIFGRGASDNTASTMHGTTHWLAPAPSSLNGIDVNVSSASLNLTIDTDESYVLKVAAPRVSLTASTVYGALRGLESFSQLVHKGSVINATTITDRPRFHFRATMIDTSRHWYPVTVILQHLDAMSYSKFNGACVCGSLCPFVYACVLVLAMCVCMRATYALVLVYWHARVRQCVCAHVCICLRLCR